MHAKLKERKMMSLFDLVLDPNNDFQKTALNTHILAILLDRQWARMVMKKDDAYRKTEDAITVYFVSSKAARDYPCARDKLQEDLRLGVTWITRWDQMLIKLVRERLSGSLDAEQEEDQDRDAGGGDGSGGPSTSDGPGTSGVVPPAKKPRRGE
jgi:hypothetical protein